MRDVLYWIPQRNKEHEGGGRIGRGKVHGVLCVNLYEIIIILT